jgi:preprotein translocase subunit SecA
MIGALARRLFGSANDRLLSKYRKTVERINALEADLEALSDDQLRAKTEDFRERLDKGETLEKLLPEAFAAVREAAKRTLGQRHYDVQLLGGMVLHEGNIAEMKTGEGKTLVATLPVYLNAIGGKGAHVVTVNDYLAKRDAEWMGRVYGALGLTTGCIVHGLDDLQRKEQYASDVTYGTNNEFGFDYLRDNMKFSLDTMVQRDFNFAIVDEVDSILIDEARTPLVISGPAEDSSEEYLKVDALIPKLGEEDYEKDEKQRAVSLTDEGTVRIEELLREAGIITTGGLYDIENVSTVHHVNQALRAHQLFTRDVDYIVKDDKVVIIDEFTGRMMEGRRYSEGLHQALEAKEGVKIQTENQTLASITFQNYFRLYPKLAGMTGTAMTEAEEFGSTYGLDVLEMPTHKPMVRDDQHDEVYRTGAEKYFAIAELIDDCHKRGQPVLVGTISIEKSEMLSATLKKRKIKHNVLNARYHEQEASIIAQAGRLGAVTIATNMAGRGTDIQLGGNAEMRIAQEIGDKPGAEEAIAKITAEVEAERAKVLEAGGLYIVGTERHESRRIDNQLRGRSGRQGDPGASKFLLSLEDDLMRIFGSERLDGMLQKLGLEEGEAITHAWVNKAIERAQKKVEARNFDIRKSLLRFDNVMNDQRKVIYEQRRDLMQTEDVSDTVNDMRHHVVEDLVARCIPPNAYPEQWETDSLEEEVHRVLGLNLPVADWAKEEGIADEEVRERILAAADDKYAKKEETYTPKVMRLAEKSLLLQIVDQRWRDHLLSLDHLRQAVGLRAYAQKDPLREYQAEAFNLFDHMLDAVRESVTQVLMHIEIRVDAAAEQLAPREQPKAMQESRSDPAFATPSTPAMVPAGVDMQQGAARRVDPKERDAADPSTWGRVGRNEPCPCGSGKKYKHCHGSLDQQAGAAGAAE